MITIVFIYETITPESAEENDFAELGFIESGHWKYPADDNYIRPEWKPGELSSFIRFAEELGLVFKPHRTGTEYPCSLDPDRNYQDGSETSYSMHVEGCTESSKQRIYRLLAQT